MKPVRIEIPVCFAARSFFFLAERHGGCQQCSKSCCETGVHDLGHYISVEALEARCVCVRNATLAKSSLGEWMFVGLNAFVPC